MRGRIDPVDHRSAYRALCEREAVQQLISWILASKETLRAINQRVEVVRTAKRVPARELTTLQTHALVTELRPAQIAHTVIDDVDDVRHRVNRVRYPTDPFNETAARFRPARQRERLPRAQRNRYSGTNI